MEGIVIPGLPAELAVIVTTLVGLLAGWITEAATAIAKKAGKTSGVTTVTVSAVLSLLVSLGFAIAPAFSGGQINLGQALVVAIIAFVRSNGAYLMRVQSNAKANREAPAIPSAVTQPYVPSTSPPVGVPLGPEHFGPTPEGIGPTAPMLRVED